ncbi:E3 ubiquitin-protein ligase NEURL3-like [Coregonus clupeaformis]|uniref:E3 ubiquitin-protein ligase NEURL3-like n=1 Tax=Coregonus clupeaformis TaxID=59861 RepID=UPI001E1C971D|nr:E3 ubiquitin-protein ligase NEURL3-like [Coregonus clupeaformis]
MNGPESQTASQSDEGGSSEVEATRQGDRTEDVSAEFCPTHGRHCLGPLSFHTGVLGTQVCLGLGGRYVERARETFQNGLTFSSRPVRIQEKIHLRVELCDQHWNGALRLGFTSIPPSSCGPLFPPAMAIPDLATTYGYWAAPVPSSLNMPGAELRFWVTPQGVLVYEGPNRVKYLLLKGVDVRSPLWAVIDVYGQTRAVLLLGQLHVCEQGSSLLHPSGQQAPY